MDNDKKRLKIMTDFMTDTDKTSNTNAAEGAEAPATKQPEADDKQPVERGGPKGPEPTRFGDWEANGRCTDF